MKKCIFTIITAVLAIVCSCTSSGSDVEAVKKVINDSYVGGIHNFGSMEVIRQGFYKDFEMLILRNNQIEKLHFDNWMSNVNRQKEEKPGPPEHLASAKYINVDVTGDAAFVQLELYREGKKLFTDYLALYKFNDGWKIVSKTFYRH